MAEVKDAKLTVSGTGAQLMMDVEVDINWDRGDDQAQWELQVRFIGADATGDNTLLVHAVAVSPSEGDRRHVQVSGAGGAFDEDRGEDEVYAEVELLARSTGTKIRKTNTVKGDFAG